MLLYPINLKIDGRLCTIIGGGRVAYRKVRSLLECGAQVKVVSPVLSDEFKAVSGEVEHINRAYQEGDLKGSFLVIAATDDEETNKAVEKEARERNLPLNIVDRPEQCDFYVPSSIRRGELMLTVSTSGRLPALSKRLRKQLEERFPLEWEEALELLGAARARVIKQITDEKKKRECLAELASLDLVSALRKGGRQAAEAEIEKCISRY